MSRFHHWKTGTKLMAGFGVCMLLTAGLGAFALWEMQQMNADAMRISSDSLPGVNQIGTISSLTRQLRIEQFEIAAQVGNLRGLQESAMHAENVIRDLQAVLKQYEDALVSQEDRQNFETLRQAWQRYLLQHEQMLKLARAGKKQQVEELLSGKMHTIFDDEIQTQLDRMVQWNMEEGKQLAAQAHDTYQRLRNTIIGAIVFALLFAALAGWFISRYITGALSQFSTQLEILRTQDLTSLQQAMHALGNGDLTATVQFTAQPIALDTRDEFGVLAKTFNGMIAQLQAMMESYRQAQNSLRDAIAQIAHNAGFVSSTSQQLSASTEQAGHASNEIARGSEQLAQQATEAAQAMDNLDRAIRTVQQGSEAQREAAQQAEEGMRQAAQAVEEVARSAQQMAASAQQASAIAQQGGQSVEEMLGTMRRIQEQAETSAQKVAQLDQLGQQIGNIVQTIEQIAEQTNLLALNAAIEAARAGEHGRGFAVVADEVRKLAEQAGSATKEIAQLISNVRTGVEEAVQAMQATSQQVSDGFARSEQVGSALVQIVESAQQVAGEVQTVTAVAEQMSASVQQVLATVSTVLQSAEENAHAALEMASGAEQVSSAIASVASISEEAAASAQELNASSEEVAAAAQE
ncbi:MAG: methyl-accepting chemotaxis protein, partial [bacterium]|nr:methyl-accepting chemotaxis protein [bacterium]